MENYVGCEPKNPGVLLCYCDTWRVINPRVKAHMFDGTKQWTDTQEKEIDWKAGDNVLSQIHRNGALQKGKAIALNSVQIKIVRTKAKALTRDICLGYRLFDQTISSTCDVK